MKLSLFFLSLPIFIFASHAQVNTPYEFGKFASSLDWKKPHITCNGKKIIFRSYVGAKPIGFQDEIYKQMQIHSSDLSKPTYYFNASSFTFKKDSNIGPFTYESHENGNSLYVVVNNIYRENSYTANAKVTFSLNVPSANVHLVESNVPCTWEGKF